MDLLELKKLSKKERKYKVFKHFLDQDDKQLSTKEFTELCETNIGFVPEYFMACFANEITNKNLIVKDILSPNIEYYENILKKFKKLVKELNLQNSLEISLLYTYLLWNGYFSKNKKLVYQSEDIVGIPGLYSYDIMSGKGVCLNFSDMLKDILLECNYDSSVIVNNCIDPKNVKKCYRPNIKRNIKKSNSSSISFGFFRKYIDDIIGNHAFNLIKDNGGLYIFDSTNLSALRVENMNRASKLAGSGEYQLKPFLSYYFNNEDSRVALDVLHTNSDILCSCTTLDYVFISEMCINLFEKNKELFDYYHENISDDILGVVDTVEYYKENEKKILEKI